MDGGCFAASWFLGPGDTIGARAPGSARLHPSHTPRSRVDETNAVAPPCADSRGLRLRPGLRLRTDRARRTRARRPGRGAARNLGNETLDRANSVKGKFSSGIAERVRRLRGDEEVRDDEG